MRLYLFLKNLMRCLVVKALSWAVVEAVHAEGDVFGCDVVESHFLGEELTNQPVHGHQGMLMGGTNHQVTLPVTKASTLAHNTGAQIATRGPFSRAIMRD